MLSEEERLKLRDSWYAAAPDKELDKIIMYLFEYTDDLTSVIRELVSAGEPMTIKFNTGMTGWGMHSIEQYKALSKAVEKGKKVVE